MGVSFRDIHMNMPARTSHFLEAKGHFQGSKNLKKSKICGKYVENMRKYAEICGNMRYFQNFKICAKYA